MTANHRIVPENSKYDIGASMVSTGRSLRIQEVIEQKIKKGEKFSVEHMVELQQDLTDVIARDMAPIISKIVDSALGNKDFTFTASERAEIETMNEWMRTFNGIMSEDSIQATVYSYWQYFFYHSLLDQFTIDGRIEGERLDQEGEKYWTTKRKYLLVDNYAFFEFYQRMIVEVQKDSGRYNRLCKTKINDKFGAKNPCAYNMARAFVDVKHHLETVMGLKQSEWNYGNIHVNEYPN